MAAFGDVAHGLGMGVMMDVVLHHTLVDASLTRVAA
jgi:glycosidase